MLMDLEDLILLRWQYYPLKVIYRFIAILMDFFCINGKANSQIHVEWQEAPHNQNSIDQKKNKPGRLTFLISKLTIKHTVIKTVCCWRKDGHIDK